MHAAEWIALLTPTMAILVMGAGAVAKLTRMADALDRLTESMKTIAEKVDGHERRISALEERSPGRHARI